ncbi:MAG: aminotransferase class V-fold PLP-dependent enzyme [Actinobacteria bacterium]|nr:MAG: aminotransferase class V-fold PLP-dependent enzyme [Actinomycetota bacterium]
MIYLDNAATSFPKPPLMLEAMRDFTERVGANPGRSGHRLSIEAGRVLLDAREQIAGLIGASDPFDVVLTKNATEALNTAILGLAEHGDHFVTTSMEHNSVSRPLRYLQDRGAETTIVQADPLTGRVEAEDVVAAIRANTKAVIMTHASNVTGTIMPVADVGEACEERKVVFVVDAAQTAGAVPVDVVSMHAGLVAMTGHKSLLGPQGTGALYVRPGIELRPLCFGGTGSSSESDVQPEVMPDKLESGTANTIGAAGLAAAVRFVRSVGVEEIREKEIELAGRLLEGLSRIAGVRVWGPPTAAERTPIVAFTLEGVASDEVAFILDRRYGVLVRVGLQCSPWAHRTLGTLPEGTVRASCGYFTTAEEIDRTVGAVAEIARGRGRAGQPAAKGAAGEDYR